MSARPTVYVDGQQGTTGLRIASLLERRTDIELLVIDEARRKQPEARAALLRRADLAVLCLPDDAAAEALELVGDADTRVIDTSTARRLHAGWVYGLPELAPASRAAIRSSRRVANPGCYPQSVILALRPLIEAGRLPATLPYTVNAVSGYSGGGRRMVERYQSTPPSAAGDAGRALCLYGLDGAHKHLPEMHRYSLMEHPPVFVPAVDHAYSGMLVSMPLHARWLAGLSRDEVYEIWRARYAGEPFVRPLAPRQCDAALRDGRFLDLCACRDSNRLELLVYGSEGSGLVLVGRLDNLGKGAAGNAVQCLNLMLGLDETTGLTADT